jgi:hypothetical protein
LVFSVRSRIVFREAHCNLTRLQVNEARGVEDGRDELGHVYMRLDYFGSIWCTDIVNGEIYIIVGLKLVG